MSWRNELYTDGCENQKSGVGLGMAAAALLSLSYFSEEIGITEDLASAWSILGGVAAIVAFCFWWTGNSQKSEALE